LKKSMKSKYKKIIALVAIVLMSVSIVLFWDEIAKLESYGYLGIFIISILGSATIVIPAPTILATFIGGGIFNPFLVGIVSAFGATIGELTGYIAGSSGRAIINKEEKLLKVEGWMKKYGLWTVFVLAVVPNPLFDLAGMVSGAGKIPVWKFLLVTLAGKTIKFLVIAFIGAGSVSVLGSFINK
jgi:membrane protein YqaA with SNARE-associated domain